MSRKIPKGYHDAIFQLMSLIGDYHSEEKEVSERDFQELFEDNIHIWAVMGYSDFIAQPKCDLIVEERISGEWIEPDFFAYNEIRDRWEIVDLKLPKKSLILESQGRRRRFSSEIESYLSQMQEYSDYFEEREHREHVESTHDVTIPPNPPSTLIMGSYIDQSAVKGELKNYSHDINVVPYDRIVDLLHKQYIEQTGENQELPGITIAGRVVLLEEPANEREYLLDIGKSTESERISVYLTGDDRLYLEIIPDSGHPLKVSVPREEVFEIGDQVILYLEFATSDEMSFARLFTGSEFIDEMVITSQIPFGSISNVGDFEGVGGEYDLYVSADLNGENEAVFAMYELRIYSEVETLKSRIDIMDHLYKKYNNDTSGIFFEDGDYAFTKDSSDLTKNTEDEEFNWVDGEDWITKYIED